jgi:hypothetical protein
MLISPPCPMAAMRRLPFAVRAGKTASTRSSWIGLVSPWFVFVAALIFAGCLYVQFLDVHRILWDNPTHDRNAHYLYSLKLATAVRNGDVFQFLNELNEARVWPPLHGVLAATVLFVGGLDYRLAVLPSLAGWVVTILFGFLVARRAVGRGGVLAGLIAALFIAASPAQRAFATDIMLESLGGALSLVVLYAYLVAVQGREDETWKGRWLGLALSLLFLEKYNYWLLVVLALLAAELVARPRLLARLIGNGLRSIVSGRWALAQLRHPLNWAVAVVLLLTGFVWWHGDRPFFWGERRVSLYPPHNVIHLAYMLLFLRLAAWWWQVGRQQAQRLDPRLRQVILWHVCPVAVWMLLPKHPSFFLWYLSLANAAPQQQIDLGRGLHHYGTWLIEDYHLDLRSALLTLGLSLIGLLSWRRLRPGGQAVLLFVLLAGALAVAHPNQKSRNLHSWVSAVWVMAGIGAATLIYRGRSGRWSRLAPWVASLAVAGLAWMQLPAWSQAGHAPEGGLHPAHPSMLEVTDVYLSDLDRAHRTLFLTAVPLKPLLQWTFLERYGRFDRLEEHWYGFGASDAENRGAFAEWLRTTDCDTVIYFEKIAAKDWADAGPECRLHAELQDVLWMQQRFRLVKQHDVPHYACRVQVWQRSLLGHPRTGPRMALAVK